MKYLMFYVVLFITPNCSGQELPRRVYLGIKMENLTEEGRQLLNVDNLNGVLVNEVLPNSTAEEAGIKKGDILLSINNTTLNSVHDVLDLFASQKGANAFDFQLLRNGKKITGTTFFKTFPLESYSDLNVEYASSKSEIGLQRTIITKSKKNAKLPVIAFIGGIGCYSLDSPLDTNRSEVQLTNTLSRAGFLCARLEKPGMGDNIKYCKPCNEVSFMEETEGYVQAIKALKLRQDVDSNSIYIFGHSMGGVFGPLVAQKTSLKGIIAYGTLGSNFIEYLAKTRRTIAEAHNMNPIDKDEMIKTSCECSAWYFIDKMTTKEAIIKNPACREFLSLFDLRSRAYNDELYQLNIPAIWKDFKGSALLLWGESDYVSSKEDHKIITDAINYYHEGKAEFVTVKNTDHAMNSAISFSEAQRNSGTYNAKVGKIILDWFRKINKV